MSEANTVGVAIRKFVQTTRKPIYDEIPSRLAKEHDATEEEIEDALDWMVQEGLLYVGEMGGETVVKVA